MELRIFNNQNGAALLTSLLLMSLLTIVGVSALSTTDIELKIAGNEKSAAQALYAAEAGVYSAIAILKNDPDAWKDLAQNFSNPVDGVNDDLFFSPLSVGAGDCAVVVHDNDDGDGDLSVDSDKIVSIRSTGRVNGSEKTIEVVFSQRTIGGMPRPNGALSVHEPEPEKGGESEATLTFFGSGNKTFIDGNDRAFSPGEFDDGIPGVPGVYFERAPQNLDTLNTRPIDGFFDTDDDGISDQVVAVGDEVANASTAEMWIDLANKLIGNAVDAEAASESDKIVRYDSLPKNSAYGTPEKPQVTIVTQYDTLSSNSSGAGVLIIEAGAKITGKFTFEGLVIVLADNVAEDNEDPDNNQGSGNDMYNTTKDFTGNSNVFGATVFAGGGVGVDIEVGGNTNLTYDSEMLNVASDLLEGLGGSFSTQTLSQVRSWKLL